MEDRGRIRVLLADDHRIVREALRMVLATECEVVAEAADGEQAVALAAQLKPQVVVMDLAMPGIGGLSAARRIAKEAPACKVLMLSQYDDEEYVLEALGEAGCAGYVVKTDAARARSAQADRRGCDDQGGRATPRHQRQDRAGASRQSQAEARAALDGGDGALCDQAQIDSRGLRAERGS